MLNLLNNPSFIFLFMLEMHVFADFHLQGFLASSKQKAWWYKQEGYSNKYKNDWLPCLCFHSIEWVFFIMLPLALYLNSRLNIIFITIFIFNAIVHIIVDHLKRNLLKINLIQDQLFHLIQICITYAILIQY